MSAVLDEFKIEDTILFPQNIRFHPELSFGERVFLAEIRAMSQKGNYPKLTSRHLADLFGVSHQTIQNWVHKLVEMGLLKIEFSTKQKYILKCA